MNRLHKSWLFPLLFLTLFVKSAYGVNLSNLLPSQWYWYLHVTPQNKIQLISLVRLNHPEGATNADTSFHFFSPSAPLQATASMPIGAITGENWQHQDEKQLTIQSKLLSTLYTIGNPEVSNEGAQAQALDMLGNNERSGEAPQRRLLVRGRSNFAEAANPPYASFVLGSLLSILALTTPVSLRLGKPAPALPSLSISGGIYLPLAMSILWLGLRPPMHGTHHLLQQHIESGITAQSNFNSLTFPVHHSDSSSYLMNNIRANIRRLSSTYQYLSGATGTSESSPNNPPTAESLVSVLGQMRSLQYVGLYRFNSQQSGDALLWQNRGGGFSGLISHRLLARIGFLQGVDLNNPEHMSPERWTSP